MKLDIIIPVYRNADMVETCVETLVGHLGEVAGHDPRIIVINDSPDDPAVSALLDRFKRSGMIHELIVNAYNQGFVRSVNRGLRLARDRGAAALLVNSDTLTYRNTVAEMLRVMALDPQIGFVSPRSNNASIATFPQNFDNMSGPLTAEAGYKSWHALHAHLPRFSWAPTAVGFYMLIAPNVIRNFSPLDESFGFGYEEENDLVMRAGKVGYRAVLANHAYAYHAGSASFLLQKLDLKSQRQGNLQKIAERHPEFMPLIWEYESSPEYLAELQLKQLLPPSRGKLKIAINLLSFGQHHNGTSELVMNFLRWCDKSAPDAFEIHALCKHSAAAFHGIDRLTRIKVVQDIAPNYAIAIFPGQPFDNRMIDMMERLAPINVYGMLDVIALDCGPLRAKDDVKSLWPHVARHANGVFFISQFSETTFRNRFERQFEARAHTHLLPTQLAPYEARYAGCAKTREHILVMGNHFAHKGADEAAALIAAAFPDKPLVAMSGATRTKGLAKSIQAGVIPESTMDELMTRSSVIVLPSYYEGFGLSLLHALALGKPIVARDLPPTREILATYGQVDGVFLFNDNSQIAGMVGEALALGKSSVSELNHTDWDNWSESLFAFCQSLMEEPQLHHRLANRIEARKTLRATTAVERTASTSRTVATTSSDEGNVIRIGDILQLEGEIFVRSLYEQFLGRPAEPSGLEHHILLLENGTSKVEMVKAFIGSTEFAERRANISLIDEELLMPRKRHRVRLALPKKSAPKEDTAAPSAVADQPHADVDLAQLLAMDAEPFVRAFYTQLLRRPADAAGLNHHLALLEKGTTRQDMLQSILRSEEFSGLPPLSIANLAMLERPKQSAWKKAIHKMTG